MWNLRSILAAIGGAVLLCAATAFISFNKGKESGIQQTTALWTSEKLVTAQAIAEAVDRFREVEQEWNQKLQEAQANARQRETTLRRDAAAAHTAALGLRQQVADANSRIATASEEAVRQYATTVSDVLGVCTDRYRAVAEKADGHASDALMLLEAWPE